MRCLLICLPLLISIGVPAQTIRLENDPVRFIDHLNTLITDKNFGGVSGIEYVQERNKWYFITDGDGKVRRSYLFEIEGDARDSFPQWNYADALKMDSVQGLTQTEAIRFDKKNFWVCTEEGFESSHKSDTLEISSIAKLDDKNQAVETPIFRYSSKLENRGHEALTFAGRDTLSAINEWPSSEDGRYARLKLMTFADGPAKILSEYAYEIDINSCVSEKDTVDGSTGNGISEMLYIDHGRFLVLERCFNRKKGFVKIYETRILPESTNVNQPEFKELTKAGPFRPLPKQEVFNFNSIKDLKIDNLEGMTWGSDRKTIVVISDNNYQSDTTKQKTQWIVLKVSILK